MSADDADAPAGEAKASAGDGRKWRLTPILAVATSLIAVAAGGVGLLFKVDPAAEPCIGGTSASFVDAPVFPESRKEYGVVSMQKKYQRNYPSLLGAEVRATVEVDNLRGNQVTLYYTLLSAGAGGTTDRVVSGADQIPTQTEIASSCTWRGGFDEFVEPQQTAADLTPSLDPRKTYRIVLELFQGQQREVTGGNRLALYETPVFHG